LPQHHESISAACQWLCTLTAMAMFAGSQTIGRSAAGGNDLIIEQIHDSGGGVPRRTAPLILFSTFCDASLRRIG
jgi:hypothetical protein